MMLPARLTGHLISLVLACSPLVARSQTLRCAADLVTVGDAMASVLKKCGEPATRESACIVPHTLNADGRTARPDPMRACVKETALTYRFGYGQPVTTLRFEDGRLQTITYGARQ